MVDKFLNAPKIGILTQSFRMHPFSTSWKQETLRFSDICRGVEKGSIGNEYVKLNYIMGWLFDLIAQLYFVRTDEIDQKLFLLLAQVHGKNTILRDRKSEHAPCFYLIIQIVISFYSQSSAIVIFF